MTTYYVNKTYSVNGDGTTPLEAASTGAAGAFSEIRYVLDTANVPNGIHTIEIAEGSGPYGIADFFGFGVGYFRPLQEVGSIITYNWNGNELQACWNVNDQTLYKWTASTGRPGQYYLTALDDSAPKLPWDIGTTIPGVEMCVINGVWNDDTMNLSNNTSYKIHNWQFNDFDTLGFSTLYVKLQTLTDPTTSGYEIFISRFTDKLIVLRSGDGVSSGYGTFIFNDAIMSGGGDEAISINSTNNKFNRCTFRWGGTTGLSIENVYGDNNIISYCRFIDFTHRAIQISDNAENNAVYNSFFNGPHLGIKIETTTGVTFTAKNNIFYNMYAGAIQHDNPNPTFIESNNIYHLDPQSTHSGKAIAFTVGTRQWTTTDSTDFPASTATTDTVGTDPKVLGEGKIANDSVGVNTGIYIPGVNDGGELDIWGKPVYYLPNIGADQGAGTPIFPWGVPPWGNPRFGRGPWGR